MDVEPPLQILGWDFVLLHLLGSVERFLGSRALTEVVQLAALCRSSSLLAQMEYRGISEEQGFVSFVVYVQRARSFLLSLDLGVEVPVWWILPLLRGKGWFRGSWGMCHKKPSGYL